MLRLLPRAIRLTSQAQLARGFSAAASAPTVKNLINGEFLESATDRWVEVTNPANQDVIALLPETTAAEFDAAVAAAKAAFPAWRRTPVSTRARVMLKLQQLIRENMDVLSENITLEQGKTLGDSRGDVFRGLEVVEYSAGIAPQLMGSFVEHVATGMDTYSIRQPLGVVAGICPFNFPAMVPLWMWPVAIAAGNTFILKPSEKDPGASIILADLAQQAGLPPGVLNIVHGTHDTVNRICDHPDIQAISFVGSNQAGQYVYQRGSKSGKRVQANLGAKNHAVIMPDANREATLSALTGAAFGAAGQRCMAVSAAVFVGGIEPWKAGLIQAANALKVSAGCEAGADVGPLISPESKARVERLIQSGVDQGAHLLLDGRNVEVPGYESGNFVGPTLIAGVTTEMDCWKSEIFGPVLVCLEVDTLDEAIALVNSNEHGNGTALFTRSGVAARKFQSDIEVGMVGINVPIPVPLPFFSFSGWKGSFNGDLHMYGNSGVQFYTQQKTITTNWKDLDDIAGGKAQGLEGVGSAIKH